jgi:uncharacterized protein (TIGR03067 family)
MTATLIAALTAGLLAAGAPQADPAKDEAVKAELKKLDGTWAFQSITVDGQEAPPANFSALRIVQSADGSFTIKATVGAEERVVAAGKSVIDPSASPKTFDRTYTEGRDKGGKTFGIYELDGDTLKLCLVKDDAAKRPKEFASKPGSGQVLSVLKRVKP